MCFRNEGDDTNAAARGDLGVTDVSRNSHTGFIYQPFPATPGHSPQAILYGIAEQKQEG